jgi:hypothetical protein
LRGVTPQKTRYFINDVEETDSYLDGKVKVKVKFFRYRAEKVLGDPEVKAPDFVDFRHNEGGKVFSLTHWPSLPPGVFLVLIFRD